MMQNLALQFFKIKVQREWGANNLASLQNRYPLPPPFPRQKKSKSNESKKINRHPELVTPYSSHPP